MGVRGDAFVLLMLAGKMALAFVPSSLTVVSFDGGCLFMFMFMSCFRKLYDSSKLKLHGLARSPISLS